MVEVTDRAKRGRDYKSLPSKGGSGGKRAGLAWVTRFVKAMDGLSPASVTANRIMLARIMEGEAHHEFMDGDFAAAYAVGWVARNRLDSGRYGATYQAVAAGFRGVLEGDPSWPYLVLAWLVMRADRDPTGGALYALSQQDVDNLSFDESEATLIVRVSPDRAVFCFKEWLEEEHRVYVKGLQKGGKR